MRFLLFLLVGQTLAWAQVAEVAEIGLDNARVVLAGDRSSATITFAEREVTVFWKEATLPVSQPILVSGDAATGTPLLFLTEETGYYLPWQAGLIFNPATAGAVARVQPVGDAGVYLVRFGKMNPEWLRSTAEAMQIPSRGPLQITENTNAGFFVYDLETKTSGYAILQANERLNTPGLVCGAGQPGVVLVRSTATGLELAAGGFANEETLRVKLFGDWQPAANESGIKKTESKAGRTWVEWDGKTVVRLERLPARGFVQRILDLLEKK